MTLDESIRMTLRRVVPLLAVLAAVAVAAGCGGDKKAAEPKVPADAVAVVDGTPILKKDFDHVVAIGLASYKARQQPAPKAGTAEFETLKQQAMGYLFQQLIIKDQAKKQKVTVDQKKVDEQLAAAKKQAGDDKKWQEALKKSGTTEQDYKDTFAVQQLAQGLFDKITKSTAAVTAADIEKRYAKDKETTYKVPASRKVVHILIGMKDGASPKNAADYKKLLPKALDVVKQLDGGANFTKLVDKLSTDPGKTSNHGEYDVTKAGFDPAFTKASYALKTGEYTKEPVKSAFGYHIIKALKDATTDSYKTVAAVKDQIKAQLEQERKQKTAGEWFQQLLAQYTAQASFSPGYTLPATTTAAGSPPDLR